MTASTTFYREISLLKTNSKVLDKFEYWQGEQHYKKLGI